MKMNPVDPIDYASVRWIDWSDQIPYLLGAYASKEPVQA